MAFELQGGLTPELAAAAEHITGLARGMGLDFWEISFELLDHDALNEVAAYGGFPTRYPHWKWGMDYEQLQKGYIYGLQKIYELVINNDPCYAYLMKSNALTDQKLVMAHVCGHADFFKNNLWFSKTNRKMMDQMANHGTRIRRYAERHGHEEVETFIDACLSLENLIDIHSPFIKRRGDPTGDDDTEKPVPIKLRSKEYMDRYVNPPEFLEAQQRALDEAEAQSKHFPEQPERDIMLFLRQHAPLERWQRDVLGMIRDEAYYFAPQAQTKILNEGWACLAAGSRVFTERGLITMQDLVSGDATKVCDGDAVREVYDRNVIRDHETIKVQTRRGFVLEGSNNHRLLLADGVTWRRLDELQPGDHLRVSGGEGLWAEDEVRIEWSVPERVGLSDVAENAGVSIWTVLRHRAGRRVRRADAVAVALLPYDAEVNQALPQSLSTRAPVRLPQRVDTAFGAFLGYLIGDGHISRIKRTIGFTSGDECQVRAFVDLAARLFEVTCHVHKDEGRWRARFSSETVADFLEQALGLTSGQSARTKHVPEAVLRSPEPVVRAFLRAYFDSDGYAGAQGVILSTASDSLAHETQLLLLNYGILTRRRKGRDECWHVHATGASAKRFAERVGFGLERKQEALESYVADRRWFKTERWDDEVVSLQSGRADVYDISVRETHRYAAEGLINHNSYWHSTLMTTKILDDSEVVDYADAHAGTMGTQPGRLNPYKLGIELFRDIEQRWNKGKFGPEWENCDNAKERREWDKKLGLGREKIFEVRKIYNDVLFIDEFLTEEFAIEQKMFTFEYSKQGGEYVIASREFKAIKQKLLNDLTNWGNPVIMVTDGNYENRGELYLTHRHDGSDLRMDQAKDTLENIQRLWTRPVHIETTVEKRKKIFMYNGHKHSERSP